MFAHPHPMAFKKVVHRRGARHSRIGEHFESNRDAKDKLFDYIEVFYNQKRRHSSLGYATPAEYERAAIERHVA